MTKIEWTDEVVNHLLVDRVVSGSLKKRGWACAVLSSGCQRCYAQTLNTSPMVTMTGSRFGTKLPYNLAQFHELEPVFDEVKLRRPLGWRKPRFLFPCDMTDWCLSVVLCRKCGVARESTRNFGQVCICQCNAETTHFWPSSWLQKTLDVWDEIARSGSIVQALTKRPTRMFDEVEEWSNRSRRKLHRNVWLGFSAENQETYDDRLTPAAACSAYADGPIWCSFEPLLGPIETGADSVSITAGAPTWGVVGGESGKDARPCGLNWIAKLIDQFRNTGRPLFVKQLGSNPWNSIPAIGDHAMLPFETEHRKGGDPDEWPMELRVREYPWLPGQDEQLSISAADGVEHKEFPPMV